jgi:glycosyltransferase involved in cell wall biosynthesis
MNLLQIIGSMDPRTGGTCQAVRNLALQAVEQGHTMEVISMDDPHADFLRQESIPIHALGRGRGPWAYNRALAPWLDENLSRFDAVVLNGLWLYPGFALMRTAQKPDAPPYFIFPHGMLDPWFQRAPERRFKAVRNWLHWKLVEHRIVQKAAALLFTCAEELRLARGTFRPYQPQREINVGFGINPPPAVQPAMAAAFADKCPGLNDRPFFLFLGRIHPKKGVDLLIQAYAAVYGKSFANGQTSGPNPLPAPCLVIVGPGLETEYGKQMQALAARLCPPGSVFWPGMLTGDAKWGALYQAEAFTLMSHQENFGMAVAEALACRTPVLISNQINIWREIIEDHAGLAAPDDLAGATRLFQSWQNLSPAEKAAMQNAARLNYETKFRVDIAAKKLLATIRELSEPLPAPAPEPVAANLAT